MALFYLFIFIAFLCIIQPVYADAGESSVVVKVQAGYLTVKATDTPIAIILQEIAYQTDIKIYSNARAVKDKITAEVHNLPIEEGLKRILDRYNFALLFSGGSDSEPSSHHSLMEIWVFSKGEGTFSLREVGGKTTERPDQSTHMKGILALGEKQDQSAIPLLLNFLSDTDRNVRLAALNTLNNFSDQVPVNEVVALALRHEDPQTRRAVLSANFLLPADVKADYALHDPSPEVRIEALHALLGNSILKDVAKKALDDPDPSVQTTAREILNNMEEDSYSNTDSEQDTENLPETGEEALK